MFTRQVAGAIGVAVIGSVFNSAYSANVSDALAGLPPQAAEAAGNSIGAAIQVAVSLPGDTGAALIEAARQSFVDAMGTAIFIPIGIALVGAFLIARFMPAHHLSVTAEPGQVTTVERGPAPTEQ